MWRQLQPDQVGGPRRGAFYDEAAVFDCILIPFLCTVGVGFDCYPVEAGLQLAGGELSGDIDDTVHHPSSRSVGEMGGGVAERLGPPDIDVPGDQRVPHPGEALPQFQRKRQLGVGGAAGQTQRDPDLSSGRFCGPLRVAIFHDVDDRCHIAVHLCVVIGPLPVVGLEHGDSVVG